jgi:hypothetical protein
MWQNLTFPVSPAKVHAENKWMYTRVNELEPQRNTDGAIIYISARSDNEDQVGMVFMDYTIEFKAPQVPRPYDPTPDEGFFARFTEPIVVPSDVVQPVDFKVPVYNSLKAVKTGLGWIFPVGTYLWNALVCSRVETKTGNTAYSFQVSPEDDQWGLPATIRNQTPDDGQARGDLNPSGYFVSDGEFPFQIDQIATVVSPATATLTLLAGSLLMQKVKTV